MLALREIVDAGLCIGCGLCEAIAGPERVRMTMTPTGVERPAEREPVTGAPLAEINRVCPGIAVDAGLADDHEPGDVANDPLWGRVRRLAVGHATDPQVRHEAATGGVLTALGQYLLGAGRVERVLHVGPSADEPLRWAAKVSTTPDHVLAGATSCYGPVAPLVPLLDLIDDDRPAAVIAKPCDAAAVRAVLAERPAARDVVRYVLVMACGGASKMTKTWGLLDDHDLGPDEVETFRYRGHGNPGPTHLVTRDGRVVEVTYDEFWGDTGTWDLQWRCKVCPDGMGELADVVSLDCWPGGSPTAEDAGFNGIIARTAAGADLLDADALTITEDGLDVATTLESWQPHQSRRRRAVAGRVAAMAAAGVATPRYAGFRLDALGDPSPDEGTLVRIARGAHRDPVPAWPGG
ncbi:MAG: Coenzyme F420 hydrogenase/dehydrogenase, beta subunit C-terminal domain [Actinomycetota bacterium]|nr:Coenzyme F420 hydrogenase/dehydrogenase, beta subunit C-terminal domain [Actinomycetota bacterium]